MEGAINLWDVCLSSWDAILAEFHQCVHLTGACLDFWREIEREKWQASMFSFNSFRVMDSCGWSGFSLWFSNRKYFSLRQSINYWKETKISCNLKLPLSQNKSQFSISNFFTVQSLPNFCCFLLFSFQLYAYTCLKWIVVTSLKDICFISRGIALTLEHHGFVFSLRNTGLVSSSTHESAFINLECRHCLFALSIYSIGASQNCESSKTMNHHWAFVDWSITRL